MRTQRSLKRSPRLPSALLVVALVALAAATVLPDPLLAGDNGKGAGMSPAVKERADRGGPEMVDVIVQFDRQPGKAQRDDITARGGQVRHQFRNLPLLALRVPGNALNGLARGNGVRYISLDSEVAGMSPHAKQTAKLPAPGSPAHVTAMPDVAVAVLDSGVGEHWDTGVQTRLDCTVPAVGGTATVRDEFNSRSFANNDGTASWSTPWEEIGESNGTDTGEIEVEWEAVCPSGDCLNVEADSKTGVGVMREANLLGAASATLSYTYGHNSSGGEVALQVSPDGGASWTELRTFVLNSTKSDQADSFDLTPYASSNTRIRFLVTDHDKAELGVDDVEIAYAMPAAGCPASTGSSGNVAGTYRDEFNSRSYGNSDGSLAWTSSWVEIDEPNGSGASGGPVQVSPNTTNCASPNCLRVGGTKPNNPDPGFGVYRDVDLGGVEDATMTFSYRRGSFDGGTPTNGTLSLDISNDGGASWTTLETWEYNGKDTAQVYESIDLGSGLSASSRIRFLTHGPVDDIVFFIDNIEIATQVETDDPYDKFGHGTHVAGFIAGNGQGSSGTYAGIAPGAPIYSLRVLNSEGKGVVSDVINALDWVLDHKDTHNLRVVNVSLGKALEEPAADDPLVQAVEAVWDAGLVVVCSAGNYGRHGNFTITSPGNSRKVITVGSLTDNETGDDYTDDYVSTYSSRGPTAYDHFLKPDLIAPGNRVVAPIATGKLKRDLPERVFQCNAPPCDGGDYLELSGTSMAAAMVSGAAALMLSQEPTLNPDTVKARLMRSARKIPGNATDTGAGVLDIEAALADTGYVAAAPSPRMARSEEGPVILVEDTAFLWSEETFGAAFLWSEGFLWSDSYLASDGFLWSDAFLWSEAFVWSDAFLWSDGFLWSDAFLWSEAFVWSDAFLWSEADPLYSTSASAINLQDDAP